MLLIFQLALEAVFILLGVLFSCGKGAWLIAGYNTASEEEKESYDEKKLCKFMGKLMFILAACWFVIASSEIFHVEALLWAGLVLFFAAAVGGVIYANTGGRFKK